MKLWIDADVLEWFKTQKGGGWGYQTKINAALRKVVDGERGKVGFGIVSPEFNCQAVI